MSEKIIQIGIGILLINEEGRILYGLRKSKHGYDTYSPPWGHLEYGERIEECAKREVFEEAGITIKEQDIRLYATLNEIHPNNEKHYINIITVVQVFEWIPINKEPEKLEEWKWMNWKEIQLLWEKNFLPMQNFIKQYPYFDPRKI